MQRGIIGVPVQSSDRLTTVEPYHDTREEYDMTLTAAVAPQEQQTFAGDAEFIVGRALKEDVDDDTHWIYDEDQQTVAKQSTRTKVQQASEFVAVPADESHNGFAMVTSNDGTFAFGVLGQADLTPMDRARIALGDFYLHHEDAFNIQTGGQQGRLDKADTLMAWGDKIEDDDDLGAAVHNAARSNTLPQLAGQYTSPHNSRLMRVNLAASGYVEVWEPEMSTFEFLDWVRADILPFVDGVDSESTDKSERAQADDDQQGLEEFDGNDGEECDRCEREADLSDYDGGRYCPVCIDAFEDAESEASPDV